MVLTQSKDLEIDGSVVGSLLRSDGIHGAEAGRGGWLDFPEGTTASLERASV